MATLIGLSGSLRRGSFNTAHLRAAAGLVPDGSALSVRTVHGIHSTTPPRKRPTIVGETTHGGANPTTIYRVTDRFCASIPFASSKNAITRTDSGRDGVKPDVDVPANQALLTAHLMALKKALKKVESDPDAVASLKRSISEKEKELEALKARK